jgi:hypothetical protein
MLNKYLLRTQQLVQHQRLIGIKPRYRSLLGMSLVDSLNSLCHTIGIGIGLLGVKLEGIGKTKDSTQVGLVSTSTRGTVSVAKSSHPSNGKQPD